MKSEKSLYFKTKFRKHKIRPFSIYTGATARKQPWGDTANCEHLISPLSSSCMSTLSAHPLTKGQQNKIVDLKASP